MRVDGDGAPVAGAGEDRSGQVAHQGRNEANTDHALTIVKLSPAEEVRLSPTVAPHSRVVTNGIKCGISPLMGPTTSDAQDVLRFVKSIWHEARTPDGTVLATLPYSQDCNPGDPWVIE